MSLRSNRLSVGRERTVMTSSRLSVFSGGLCGLLPMVAALGMVNLVGGLASSISSPFLAVGASS